MKKAFTLVELIVVITILAILGTIAYISFQSFSQDSRDSIRVSDINTINRTLKFHATKFGAYPDPDNATAITFSGATAWNQGEFGTGARITIRQLNDVPVDPLTGSNYAYSKTVGSNEYQLGAVLEGVINPTAFSPFISQSYAGDQVGYSYIRGNYNERFLPLTTGGRDYILAVPSIIASDILDAQLVTIAANQTFSYHGTTNLPATYTGTIFANTPVGGFNYPTSIADLVTFSGSFNDLNDAGDQLEFVTNLQKAYSGTSVEPNVSDIIMVNTNSSAEVHNLVATFTNSEVGGLEKIGLVRQSVSSGGSGGGEPASATANDIYLFVGPLFADTVSPSLSNGNVACSSGITTYGHTPVGGFIDSFDTNTGDYALSSFLSPDGTVLMTYDILCDGVITASASIIYNTNPPTPTATANDIYHNGIAIVYNGSLAPDLSNANVACSSGTTTYGYTPIGFGASIVSFDANTGDYGFTLGFAGEGTALGTYNILCDGISRASASIIYGTDPGGSGGGSGLADAVNDFGISNLAANDTLCSSGVTSFSNTAAASGFVVQSFNTADGNIVLTNNCHNGTYNYSILCDGVVADTATVTMGFSC